MQVKKLKIKSSLPQHIKAFKNVELYFWIGTEKELPSLSPRMCCSLSHGEWPTSLTFLNATCHWSWLDWCNCVLPAHLSDTAVYFCQLGKQTDLPVKIQSTVDTWFIFTFLQGLLKSISLSLVLVCEVRLWDTSSDRVCCEHGVPPVTAPWPCEWLLVLPPDMEGSRSRGNKTRKHKLLTIHVNGW